MGRVKEGERGGWLRLTVKERVVSVLMRADYDKGLLTPDLQLPGCSSVCFPHRPLDTRSILLHVTRPVGC